MCVCVSACIHVCACMHVCAFVFVHVCIFVHACLCVRACVCGYEMCVFGWGWGCVLLHARAWELWLNFFLLYIIEAAVVLFTLQEILLTWKYSKLSPCIFICVEECWNNIFSEKRLIKIYFSMRQNINFRWLWFK